jgi:hypothetical protein
MTSPRSRQAARLRARRRRGQQRARRIALLTAVGLLAIVTLLLTAFGSAGTRQVARIVPTQATFTSERPQAIGVATIGNLKIQLPVGSTAVTATGFHGSDTGALTLKPLGRQANEGLLARLWHRIAGTAKPGPDWFQLGGAAGPGTEVLIVGAAAGTDVYAPVGGTIAAISPTIINGHEHGSRVDIRPTAAPSVVVSVTHVVPDPGLAIGSTVTAGSSRLGSVVDIAKVERQSLAAHTNDAGNNVAIDVHPAPSSLP